MTKPGIRDNQFQPDTARCRHCHKVDNMHAPDGTCPESAPQPEPAPERSDKDYAIEHGGYLATAAEGYMEAVNKYSAGEEDSDYLSDHWRALQSAIGEFRKRAARVKP